MSIPGPRLPLPTFEHAMVSINASMSMLIGGSTSGSYYSQLTFYFDHEKSEWKNGPNLNTGRSGHTAGIVSDSVTGAQIIAVTGGYSGSYPFSVMLDSTELLIQDKWIGGK